jgi:sortase A
MTTRTSSESDMSCAVGLFVLAGVLLVVAGSIMAYPLISDMLLPPPASFGEAQPPLRPTVTPIPGESPAAVLATPDLLPEEPVLSPGQPLPSPVTTLRDLANSTAKPPTRLVIPAINLDAPIEPVGWSLVNGVNTWTIPHHFAAGWLETSAPWSRPGNTVLDGHHNTAGEVFRHLVDLKAGDVIEVYADDRVKVYEVTALHILRDRDQPLAVRRRNAAWIQPTWDERLTLVTCWPYTSNTHRLIVIATPRDSK